MKPLALGHGVWHGARLAFGLSAGLLVLGCSVREEPKGRPPPPPGFRMPNAPDSQAKIRKMTPEEKAVRAKVEEDTKRRENDIEERIKTLRESLKKKELRQRERQRIEGQIRAMEFELKRKKSFVRGPR